MNYIVYTPVERFGAKATLNVSERVVVGLDTFSGVKGANQSSSSDSSSGGTYAVKDNVLTLPRNRKTDTNLAFPVAGGNRNIDGQVYNKQ